MILTPPRCGALMNAAFRVRAQLLARIYRVFALKCSGCGGRVRRAGGRRVGGQAAAGQRAGVLGRAGLRAAVAASLYLVKIATPFLHPIICSSLMCKTNLIAEDKISLPQK